MYCKFTLENARSVDEVRRMTVKAYEFYRHNIGNENDVTIMCGYKTTDDYDSIIFEAKHLEEAVEKAINVWRKENYGIITSFEELEKVFEIRKFNESLYLVTYPEIKGTISVSEDFFRILKNRILLKGEDGVLVKTNSSELIRICYIELDMFEGIKISKEKIFSMSEFIG